MKARICAIILMISAGLLDAQNPRALIREIQGTVELKAPGAKLWRAAVEGQELTEATLVSTGFRSSALIAIGNSTIQVKPLTRLSLGDLRAAAASEEVTLQLRAGRIRAEVIPPARGGKVHFTVKSPVATASVRGTVFDFDTVNLSVNEGQVSFSGAGDTVVYVGAGETSVLDPVSGRAESPVETAAAQAAPAPAGAGDILLSEGDTFMPAQVPVKVGIRWPGSD
jgi:hypothetical protein